MPPTTAPPNPSSIDNQSMPYSQTSPLATHRPTRPTAVVPPLPKDPTISSPIGSSSSTPSSSSNYQQVSPQKSSNYPPKQVTCFFSLLNFKSIRQTVRNISRYIYIYFLSRLIVHYHPKNR